MALNIFTDSEAIEKCIQIRDELPLEGETLEERWAKKDAMAQVINLAEYALRLKKEEK